MGLQPNALLVFLVASLTGCGELGSDDAGPLDTGLDSGALQSGVAAIWVDPEGCQHWYIDDGIEGYMSPRLNRDGTPRCGALPHAHGSVQTRVNSLPHK